jgi:hypothetical protein
MPPLDGLCCEPIFRGWIPKVVYYTYHLLPKTHPVYNMNYELKAYSLLQMSTKMFQHWRKNITISP